MVEPQPSKLVTWVRFPSPAPNCHTVAAKSCLNYPRHANPAMYILRIEIAAKEGVGIFFRIALPLHAIVAQLAERRFCKPYVGGSSPLGSSIMTADVVGTILIDKISYGSSPAAVSIWHVGQVG